MLGEMRARMPAESIVYVADQRWAPYGDRSLEEVRSRSVPGRRPVIESGSKAVVVALQQRLGRGPTPSSGGLSRGSFHRHGTGRQAGCPPVP